VTFHTKGCIITGNLLDCPEQLPEGISFRLSLQSDFTSAQQSLARQTGGRLNGQSKVDRLHVTRERARAMIILSFSKSGLFQEQGEAFSNERRNFVAEKFYCV
jgi:hypothetical protein